MQFPRLPSLLALLAPLFAACHRGEVVVAPPPPVRYFTEAESNDHAWDANWLGWLNSPDRVQIAGHVRADWLDPQDGFAFRAGEALHVEFHLRTQCACADLDLWLYDPLYDEFVAAWDSPAPHEDGTFHVAPGREFHLVVVSAGGQASYTLDVRAWHDHALAGAGSDAAPAAAVEREPIAPRDEILGRYRRSAAPAPARALEFAEIVRIDEATGAVRRALAIPTVDGLRLVPLDAP